MTAIGFPENLKKLGSQFSGIEAHNILRLLFKIHPLDAFDDFSKVA